MPASETAVPDESIISDYERERGKPMPSKLHSRIQYRLVAAFLPYEPEYIGFSELTLELEGNRSTPDLCVYRSEDIDLEIEEVRVSRPPTLAVEIASPTQGIQTLVDKIRGMLDAGVESCWLVQPALRTITTFDSDMRSETHTAGTVTDPATSIEVALGDVFAEAAQT